MTQMVIIGGGQAAGQAVASLRQEGFDGKIVLIGEESTLPYQRPPLSKAYLSGAVTAEKLLVRPEKFYADRDVEGQRVSMVTAMSPDQQTGTTGERTCDFDKRRIATGGTPRKLSIPGSDLNGIHYLRTVADVDASRAQMKNAKRLCIVGGGYIGLEVASVAVSAGLSVDVLEMEARILQRVTTPFMSAFYHQLHEGRGVKIHTETGCSGFRGTDQGVTHVQCGDAEIEADLVIVGIGIMPNIQLAVDACLACDNGITVNDHCQTSHPDIYAAGDCTNHPNPILNRNLRLESVPNAVEQAKAAAASLCGGEKPYAELPWFWSDQFDVKLQIAGMNQGYTEAVVRGDINNGRSFSVFYTANNKILAADCINRPKDFMLAKKLILQNIECNSASLSDEHIELKSLLQ